MLNWLEINLTMPASKIDLGHSLLEMVGCIGSAVVPCDSEEMKVIGYLPSTEDTTEKISWLMEKLDALISDGLLTKDTSVKTQPLGSEAWEDAIRQMLPPLLIGRSFFIFLTDEERTEQIVPADHIAIFLQTFGGFGTGHHPTTRLCLELLENCDLKNKNVLDVGTGSGILAIASAKFGAKKVLAIDIDDASLKAVQSNAQKNDVADKVKVIKSDLLTQVKGSFDVVLSNLLTPLIKDLAWQLKSRHVLNPDGIWIGSGISLETWLEVQSLLGKLGYFLTDKRQEEGWIAFQAKLCAKQNT